MRVYSVLFLLVSTALVANAGIWGDATSWFNKQVHVVQTQVDDTVKKAEFTVNIVGKKAQDEYNESAQWVVSAADYAKAEAKHAEDSINSMGKKAQNTYSESAHWVQSQADVVKDAVKQAEDSVKDSVKKFGQNAKAAFANVAQDIEKVVSQANLDNLAKRVQEKSKKIGAFSQQQFEALQSSLNPKDLKDLSKSLAKNFESMALDIQGSYKQARDALNKDKIMSLYEDVKNAAEGKVIEMQDTLIKTLKEQMRAIPEKAYEAVQVLKVGAMNMKQHFNNTLQAMVKKADDEVNEIIKAVEGTGIDVEGCKRSIGRQLENILRRTLGSSTDCFNKKLAEGSLLFCHIMDNIRSIADDMSSLSSGDLQKVTDLVQHSFSMVSKATATADMLYTMPESLTVCVNMMNLDSLTSTTTSLVSGIKKCVDTRYKQFVNGLGRNVRAAGAAGAVADAHQIATNEVNNNNIRYGLICDDENDKSTLTPKKIFAPQRAMLQCTILTIPY